MTIKEFCAFFVGELCVGVETVRVQEVLRPFPMTRVPRTHPAVRGVVNLRGQIVTAIDLRRQLGIPDAPEGTQKSMNVVLCSGANVVSLLVDRIFDVVQVDESSFERPPETVSISARAMIHGAYKLPDRLLLELNVARATSLSGGGLGWS